jgi:hypothetical protein
VLIARYLQRTFLVNALPIRLSGLIPEILNDHLPCLIAPLLPPI